MEQTQLKHVAIIMDGNRRWAVNHKKPKNYGHKVGVSRIRDIAIAALENNISYLTLFAFSTENWNRSKDEVTFLFNLFETFLNKSSQIINWCNDRNIQLNWIGFKENISNKILNKIYKLQDATKSNSKLVLTIAFNYGGLQDILQAAKKLSKEADLIGFKKLLLTSKLPPVDLLIRTGNETRISNFLLFDIAYAEIIFEKVFWPDYNKQKFEKNLYEFYNKKRRFGV